MKQLKKQELFWAVPLKGLLRGNIKHKEWVAGYVFQAHDKNNSSSFYNYISLFFANPTSSMQYVYGVQFLLVLLYIKKKKHAEKT